MMKKYLAVLVALLIGILLLMFGLMLVEQSADSNDSGAGASANSAVANPANFANDLPNLPAGDMASGNDIDDWCDAMLEKPNPEWTEAETLRFSKLCI